MAPASRTLTASAVVLLLSLLVGVTAQATPSADPSIVVVGRTHQTGELVMAHSNLGWFGSMLSPSNSWPSCEYPRDSHVEHLFLAGPWIGAINGEGQKRVSASAVDTGAGQTLPSAEYGPRLSDQILRISDDPESPYYSSAALAHEQLEGSFFDEMGTSGDILEPHEPLGLRVDMKSLVYYPDVANDFIILLFEIENVGDSELNDVYVGWYTEFTVGNTTFTIPGDDIHGWNFYDDISGYLGPGDVASDPSLRMMHCHDPDGDEGHATSWAGVRLLGTGPVVGLSAYRQWRFGNGPRFDADKYDWMASGQIDVGIGEGGVDFGALGSWVSLLAVGPWPTLAVGQRIEFSIAVVGGVDRDALLANSLMAQRIFDNDLQVPVSTRQGSWGDLKSRFRKDR